MTSRRNHRGRPKHSSEEYCRGFVDKHGQWNNGFYCPRWGGPDRQYCCGPEDNKYCCPKQEVEEKLHDNQVQQISLLIGLAIGSIILLIGTTILSCFFCHCCWAYKRRKRLQNPPQLPAYPGLSRDSSDAVNYAMCPHGTIFPEFMVAAPQYPSEAPPPYPGDEPALRLMDKQSLPAPSVQIETERSRTRETDVDGQQIDVDSPTEPSRGRQCTNHDRTGSECYDTLAEDDGMHSAVIPHQSLPARPCQGRNLASSRLSTTTTTTATSTSTSTNSALPGTSHPTRYQIPKYRPSRGSRCGHRHRSGHRGGPGHQYGNYDSRSLSSTDSDSCTG